MWTFLVLKTKEFFKTIFEYNTKNSYMQNMLKNK